MPTTIDITGHVSADALARFGSRAFVADCHPDGSVTVWHGYAVLTIRMEITRMLLTEHAVRLAVASSRATGDRIPDDVAATIASWWHSPGHADREITMVSHGLAIVAADDYVAAAEAMRRNREAGAGELAADDVAACVAFEWWARDKARQARDAAE